MCGALVDAGIDGGINEGVQLMNALSRLLLFKHAFHFSSPLHRCALPTISSMTRVERARSA
jgi:hypothetical protein